MPTCETYPGQAKWQRLPSEQPLPRFVPPSATQPTFPEFWIHNWHSPQVQSGGYGLTLKAGISKGIEKKLKMKLQCEAMAPTTGDTGRRNKASVSRRQPHPHGHAVYEIKLSICQGMKRRKKTWRIHTTKYLLLSLTMGKKKDLLAEVVWMNPENIVWGTGRQ